MGARRVAGRGSRALAAPLLLAAVLAGAGPGAASASTCGNGTGQPAGPPADRFFGVALSSCQAWAVGDYSKGMAELSLIEHWTGTAWKQQPSPNPGSSYNTFEGVAVTSATNAWAVGQDSNNAASLVFRTLIVRWNGTTWTRVPSPSPGGPMADDGLTGVAATSSSNAWAVGAYNSGSGTSYRALIVRWTGTTWTRVPAPVPGGATGSVLVAVAANSASNAWAVGYYSTSTGGGTLIEHWNGTTWTQVPSPAPAASTLTGVATTSASNAWVVGYYHNKTAFQDQTLIEHWNGTTWTQLPSPNPSPPPFTNQLNAVAATSASNLWVAGDYTSTAHGHPDLTLVEHWNGTTWTQLPSPSPSSSFNDLYGVAANSASSAWAVGLYVTSSQAQQALTFHCC